MKMDLVLDKNKIEASKDSYANLQVELRDRYNNLVFNDSQTEVSVEISPKYSRVISVNPEEATAKD
ncbi:MAG: hypothetical protein LBF15_06280 [Candidatus Peribacteria bacterium]|jgi:hypothetical protein|nr:hypothetical protein [Candidatus Peribacteria bacterium]